MNTDLHKLGLKIFEDAFVMVLATADDEGPWAAPVIYVHDEAFNLYWVSQTGARHSRAIEKNGKVACAIIASTDTDNERALQIEGIAERVAGPLLEYERRLEAKRGLPRRSGSTIKDGSAWYVLKPTKIELIHNQPFGYSRQTISID